MGEHEAEVLEAAIPPSLWRVLRCIFDLGTANASQISERLGTRYGVEVHPKTAGVLLLRLVERGLIRSEPVAFGRGRPSHRYTASLSKETALRGQLEAFLRQFRIEEDAELGRAGRHDPGAQTEGEPDLASLLKGPAFGPGTI